MEGFPKLPTELAYVAIAAGGGIARYLQGYLMEGKFALRHLVAHTVVSSFSGFMFYQFGIQFSATESVMPVLAGLGGWMGVSALELMEEWLRKKFKK